MVDSRFRWLARRATGNGRAPCGRGMGSIDGRSRGAVADPCVSDPSFLVARRCLGDHMVGLRVDDEAAPADGDGEPAVGEWVGFGGREA